MNKQIKNEFSYKKITRYSEPAFFVFLYIPYFSVNLLLLFHLKLPEWLTFNSVLPFSIYGERKRQIQTTT